MANYAYTPTTFNGITLSTFASAAYFMFDNGPLDTAPRDAVEADIPGLGTRDVRGQAKGKTWRLHINLKDLTEATQLAMFKCFSDEAGAVTLLATDGSAAVWKVTARVIGIQATNAVQYEIILRVADPRWQENTATTATSGTSTASTINATLTNAGNRQARAQYTLTAVAAKTAGVLDFGLSLQGFIVNRSPNDIVNKPVALFDVSGAASRIDMSTHAAPTSGAAGDDCRVWLDDVPDIPRWMVNPAAASAEVWINISLPAAIPLTLAAAIASGVSPANGASITFNEDLSRLPSKGYLAFIKEGANNDEIIYYASKAGRTVYGIQRSQWGTTASAHAVGSSSAPAAFPNPRHYVVASKNSGIITQSLYGPPPSPTNQRPAIQLKASSNQKWYWGDQADDASTIYFDRANPDRTAQWVPGFDLDGNTAAPLMSLFQSDTIVTFKDDVPGDGSPPVNFLEIAIPMGIKSGDVNAIQNTWTSTLEALKLELHARDAGGSLKLQDVLQTGAAAANRALPAALAAIAYGVKLKARQNVAAGSYYTAANVTILSTASTADTQGAAAQQFKLTKPTRIDGFSARMALAGAGTGTFAMQIFSDLGEKPNTLPGNNGSLCLAQVFTVSGTTVTKYRVSLVGGSQGGPFYLPAGTYWLVIYRSGSAQNASWMGIAAGQYVSGGLSTRGASAWSVIDHASAQDFTIDSAYNNDGTASVGDEQPMNIATTGLRVGSTASFDKSIVTFPTAQSIYVHRTGTFATTLYHMQDLLTNTTTGDSIQIDCWLTAAASATLVIDSDARTVVKTDGAVAYPITKAITPSNTADWLPLSSGANALTCVDAGRSGTGSISYATSFNGVKV